MTGAPGRERGSLAQTLMEWDPLVRIYESRLWRRSLLFAALTGISFEREQQLIADALGAQGSRRILDLGCGTGIYTRRFAATLSGGAVVGLDLSVPMLAYARRRAREEGIGNLALVRADALRLPFADACFDGANCCGALHLFPDVPGALAEVRRVVRAGGPLTLAVFRRAGATNGRVGRLTGVRPFARDELAALLHAAGFPAMQTLHARRRWMVVVGR